jgi:hypothetical protein
VVVKADPVELEDQAAMVSLLARVVQLVTVAMGATASSWVLVLDSLAYHEASTLHVKQKITLILITSHICLIL